MKMKLKYAISSLLLLITAVLCLFGCSFLDLSDKPEAVYYTVTLDRADGSEAESVSVKEGRKLEMPSQPLREGYKFLGWYEGEELFDFDKRINGNTALTARWQKKHTVSFDTSGFSEIASQTVLDGERATAPERPRREGYRFGGWFSGGEEFDFSEPVSSDLNLTVYWIKRPKNLIYDCETQLTVILPENYMDIASPIMRVVKGLNKRLYEIPGQYTAENIEESEHEIVIGRTTREISSLAYAELEKLTLEGYEVGYLIYSDGSSVAIAYGDSYMNVAAAAALSYFEENLLTDELALAPGVSHSDKVDVVEYLAAEDEEKREEQWAVLELQAGKDIADALRDFYSIYEPTMIDWYANLYDSSVGGYYYSNSARDNLYVSHGSGQYLLRPDAESTNQALNFINSSGLIGVKKYSQALPEWMKEEIIAFIRGLQDPIDGYFYHPQWTKAMAQSHISRMGRDLSWCTGVLSSLGSSPYYDTPNGYKGILPSSAMTTPMSESRVMAVSRVVATAAVPSRLASEEAFREYLAGFNLNEDSYPVGNELASQASQFVARDKQLEAEGADYRICDILIEWLNAHQYETTGHWNAVADYEGTNGLLKISSVYNTVGAPFPNAEAAMRSAIGTITTEVPAGTVCYPYNCWFSISNIMSNLRKHGDESGIADKIRLELLECAPEAIAATKEKVLTFKKADGSFSYTTTQSAATSQGLPVAIPNTNEGDVNATSICSTGTLGNIYSALGLSSYKVHLYGSADWYRYLSILEANRAAGGFPKDDTLPSYSGVYDFDEEESGALPGFVSPTIVTSGGEASVVEEKPGDKALYFKTVAGGNDEIALYVIDTKSEYTTTTFEAKLRIASSTGSGTLYQLMFDDMSGKRAYMINMTYQSGRVSMYDCSSTGDGGTRNQNYISQSAAGINEEFTMKVEHEMLTDGSVKMRIYIDGTKVLESSNYYNSHKSGSTPNYKIDKVRFYSQRDTVAELYLDEVSFKQS